MDKDEVRRSDWSGVRRNPCPIADNDVAFMTWISDVHAGRSAYLPVDGRYVYVDRKA